MGLCPFHAPRLYDTGLLSSLLYRPQATIGPLANMGTCHNDKLADGLIEAHEAPKGESQIRHDHNDNISSHSAF